MATEKVGIYRSYYGPVPKDRFGEPLPKEHWPKKRPHSWVVRWFGSGGQRYSRSFKTRKEADRFAETAQSDLKRGVSEPPREVSLKEFYEEQETLMNGSVARSTLKLQLSWLGNPVEFF